MGLGINQGIQGKTLRRVRCRVRPRPKQRQTFDSLQNRFISRLQYVARVKSNGVKFLTQLAKRLRQDNQEGIYENLKYVDECNYDDISTLKTENIDLRRELELLRSVVI